MLTLIRVCASAVLVLLPLGTSAERRESAEVGAATLRKQEFLSHAFGFNLSQSLINPLEAGASEEMLRREVAAILYDVRMGGGELVRWIVTDVWPQWRCSPDPEEPATGDLDPAWFTVSQVLLREAARNDMGVVMVLANATNRGFASITGDMRKDREARMRLAAHRQEQEGHDGYRHGPDDVCDPAPGYHGTTDEASLFSDAALRARLTQRFARMARFLGAFPALAGLELFNEPDMAVTTSSAYWSAVRQFRDAIQAASPAAARIPVFSGTAAWNGAIAGAARKSGELAREAIVSVHAYDDYANPPRVADGLRKLIAYLHKLTPGKNIVVSEIGSGSAITTPAAHASMVETVMDLYIHSNVGVWVWGNYFPQPSEVDFGLDFNHRSPVGAAFRPYFFADLEAGYATSRTVAGREALTGTPRTAHLLIDRLGEDTADPWQHGAWTLTLDNRQFIGFSRAGIFPRPFLGRSGLFANPPPTLFMSERGDSLQWVRISYMSGSWSLELFDCRNSDEAEGQRVVRTPDDLLGLSSEEKRKDFETCAFSLPRFVATL